MGFAFPVLAPQLQSESFQRVAQLIPKDVKITLSIPTLPSL